MNGLSFLCYMLGWVVLYWTIFITIEKATKHIRPKLVMTFCVLLVIISAVILLPFVLL